MEMTREALLERILQAYGSCYDIQRHEDAEAPLVVSAAYHEHGTGYLLVERAQMWTADRHEYAYFFSVPHLTKALYEECLAKTRELGEPLVNPVKGHMSTMLVMTILCDSAEDDAVKALKSCRIRKNFQFSLRGWMEVQTACVELGKDSVTANPAAANLAKFLKKTLHPQVKHSFLKR